MEIALKFIINVLLHHLKSIITLFVFTGFCQILSGNDEVKKMDNYEQTFEQSKTYKSDIMLNYNFLETSQGKIAYVDTGGSGNAIVFIHGNSCSLNVFRKQFEYFGGQYRMIAIDLPGHGKSDNARNPDKAYCIPGYAKVLDEVLTALNVDQFMVVGFSLGGNIALQWTQISEGIKGIVLVNSAPIKYSEDALLGYPPYEGSYGAFPDPLSESQATQFMAASGFDVQNPSVYFMIEDAMRTDGKARTTMVASVLSGNGFDETMLVSQLKIPIAVVVGENDRCVGKEYVAQLHYENLWRNQVQVIVNAQHAIVYHQSDLFNLLLEDFISDLMNTTKSDSESHDQMINAIILSHFKQTPTFIKRMVIGICNEVYEVGLNGRNVIVRLSSLDRHLMGSHDHIPKFQALGIKVPEILAEDYSKNTIPFSYQVQSKIEGEDLGEVIETLSETQLKAIAKEVSNIFDKVKNIPSSDKFGVIWGGGDNELSDSWTERMHIWIEESKERGLKTGVMDIEMERIANNLYNRYKSYFSSIRPTTYYGDICSKNIMILDGTFNGLVDLDGLTQGDPLEAIGRIKLSWYGTHHGELYSNALMDALKLNPKQRELVLVYALLNKISWTCENGIQFNQNTTATVDQEKAKGDKSIIMMLASALQL